jgi:hypothetical protein
MMMNRNGARWLLVAAMAASLAACGTAKKEEKVVECKFDNSSTPAPGWICDEPVAGIAVSAVGRAEKTAAGVAFQRQMAATDARVQLAQAMRVQVQNMIKQYVETTGAADSETVDRVNTSVSKQITNEMLTGTKILRSIQGPDGTIYMLVGLDPEAAQKLAETAIKTSMNNERAAWQQFRAKKGQEELAEEIAKQKTEMKR